jgi:glycosyltransferase involved in cell wall biosynthesis
MKTISVLMSVYKEDNPIFFNLALTSIWDDQTLKPNQIVLVLDGKLTDKLNEVIKNWIYKLDNKLLLVKNRDNIGLTKSLNKGIPYCKSEYIARMDSDDISDSKRFMLQVEFLNMNKNIDVLGGSILEFNDNNKSFKRIFPRNQKEILKKIAIASPFSHPTVMFRRKVFLDGNRYDEKHITSQDISFWFHLLNKGYQLANLKEVVLKYRITSETAKRRSSKKAFGEFQIYFKGIIQLFGLNIKLIYPLTRLTFRLLPIFLIKLIYNSKLRTLLNS